jgi:hypothetical protein
MTTAPQTKRDGLVAPQTRLVHALVAAVVVAGSRAKAKAKQGSETKAGRAGDSPRSVGCDEGEDLLKRVREGVDGKRMWCCGGLCEGTTY